MWFFIFQAYKNLVRNKVRTLLTSLGIFIGVFSVVILIAFGVGLRSFVEEQFDSLGSNILILFPGNLFGEDGQFQDREGGFGESKFDLNTANIIKRIPEAKLVVPTFIRTSEVNSEGKSVTTDVLGTDEQVFELRKLEINYGIFFSETDMRKKSKVAVLGDKIARELFDNPNQALGKTIRIESIRFEVIGVAKPKGSGGFGGPDFDSYIYLPHTAGSELNPSGKFLAIYVQADNPESIALLNEEMQVRLGKVFESDDFSVIEQTQILGTIQGIFGVINGILVALGSISLFVGGVGIMNIMYASVNERVKEIGIRRSMGARKIDILLQFLYESVMVSFLGGAGGLMLAFIIAIIANRWIPVQVDLLSVVVAFGVSTLIGIIFGVFPARNAASWPPIDAIRH